MPRQPLNYADEWGRDEYAQAARESRQCMFRCLRRGKIEDAHFYRRQAKALCACAPRRG